MPATDIKIIASRRPRLLWLVLGAMLLVSVLPLALYHRQVLQLSQEKLTDTESVQQTEVTRSVGEEIQLFDANLYQQLISERQILALTGLLDQVDDPAHAPQVTRLLENFVASNPEYSLPDRGGQRGQRHRRGQHSRRPGSLRGQGAATRVFGLRCNRWCFAAILWRWGPTIARPL